MAVTEDELLGIEEEVDDIFVIDNNLRTISVPKSIRNIGVASDDEVVRLKFQMPRFNGEFDLAWFIIRINYLNALNEGDIYVVDDMAIDEENDIITFSWVIGRHALAYKGNLKFNVCLKKINTKHIVVKEFNTTICSLPILEGLETIDQVIQENADILETWKEELFGINYAYRAAIQNGFVGTEKEWLASLKGDKGNTGVYIGPIEPTEYPYLWFNTNGHGNTDSTVYVNTEDQVYKLESVTANTDSSSEDENFDFTIL